VTVFEAASQAGGLLRLALPPYRLPNEVVDQDLSNVTAAGVEIVTNSRVEDLAALEAAGYDAVLVAVGTHLGTKLGVLGEDLRGVMRSADFLRAAKLGEELDVEGKRVVVVGGGNVALDAARTALRLKAASVQVASLESHEQMPAHAWEVEEARQEGVAFQNSCGVRQFSGDDTVRSVELLRCVSVFDDEGRFSPQYEDETLGSLECDLVVVAAGMRPDAGAFGLPMNSSGTVKADPGTLQTSVPHVFAAGDVVSGPSMITSAAGQGWRAAFMIDLFLRGQELDPAAFDGPLPMVDKEAVLGRQATYSRIEPLNPRETVILAEGEFYEDEQTMTEEEALHSASRCLDCGVCSECHACVDACPADAIKLDMREERIEAEVGSVVLATGFRLFPADAKPQYGYGRYRNVITGMQMDRLLAPTRPYNGVLRPSDGKVPDNIAYIMCTGSRDETVGNPLCSKICCMYSVKQNQLIMGALPLADVTVYYIDVRSVGKGYDEFYQQAKDMGANFVKGRVSGITETAEGNLVLRYEDIENGSSLAEAEHDMVVLAVGVQPNGEAPDLFEDGALALDDHYYVGEAEEDLDPGRTNLPGVFVAGAAAGAKDIPDSILHAGAAVAQAAAHLEKAKVKVPA
jgi:heterodisulfide reductase subunit A